MVETSSCRSIICNTVVEGNAKACPACGGKMRSSKAIRRWGVAMTASGLLLVGMMSAALLYLTPLFLHPNPGGSEGFTGTREQGEQALWLCTAILFFGAFSTVTGIAQAATGRRSRTVTFIALALSAAIGALVRHTSAMF